MCAEILSRFSFWFPPCSHLSTELKPIFKQRKLIKTRSCSRVSGTRWLRWGGTEGARSDSLLTSPFHLSSSLSFLQLWSCQLPLRSPQLPLGIFASHPRTSCHPCGEAGLCRALPRCLRWGHRKVWDVNARRTWHCHIYGEKIVHFCRSHSCTMRNKIIFFNTDS